MKLCKNIHCSVWQLLGVEQIQYVSLYGAQTNRDFAKLLLGTFKSDLIKTMTVKNIFSFKQEPILVSWKWSCLSFWYTGKGLCVMSHMYALTKYSQYMKWPLNFKCRRDRRPIREVGDIRLMENDKVLNWFCEWESEVLNNDQVKDRESMRD
jgi:hypothetical protein